MFLSKLNRVLRLRNVIGDSGNYLKQCCCVVNLCNCNSCQCRTINSIEVKGCTTISLITGRNFCTRSVPKHADVFGQLSDRKFERVEMDEDEEAEEKFTDNEVHVPQWQKLSVGQYSNLMKSHIAKKDLKSAIGVLDLIKQNRDKPVVYHYNLLIRALAMQGELKRCFNLYNDMKKRQLQPNDATYTSLFNVCSRWNNKKQALEYLNNLRESLYTKRYILNNTHYNAMVKAYGMHGELLTAFQLVDEMKDKRIPIDEITYHSLMHGAISDKKHGLRHALAIWHMMRRHGVKPNIYTYNLLLRATRDTKFGDIQEADFLLQGLDNSKICISESERPDLLAQPPVLSTLSLPRSKSEIDESLSNKVYTPNNVSENLPILCNNVNDVLENNPLVLFGGFEGFTSRMEKDNVLPDQRTLTMLIELLPKSTSAENAVTAYAKHRNIKLQIDYYNMLMKKRCMRDDYENAMAVLSELQQNHIAPDIITFGVLALSCVKCKQALEIIEGMEAIGYKPNAIIMGTFIKKACMRKNFDYALHMMKYMSKNNIRPTEQTLNAIDKLESNVKALIKKGNDKPAAKRILKKKLSQFMERYQTWKKKWEEK